MVDRFIDLPSGARQTIIEKGYGWFLKGENDDYLAPDAILVHNNELEQFKQASDACYKMYMDALDKMYHQNLWSRLGLPEVMVPLMRLDMQRSIPHVCGRLDLSGGIDGLPVKLIEFNADTSSLMPESAHFQSWLYEPVHTQFAGQFNFLIQDLTKIFKSIKKRFSDRPSTMLFTSLGYEEDRLNIQVLKEAAEAAGFNVAYSDLEHVIFGDDGVFLEKGDEYTQYFFVYKFIPWEFILYEEPDLMDILIKLSTDHDLIVLNPAYTLAFQAKHMLSFLYEENPRNEYLLPTYDQESPLRGKQYVRKVNFGRMGENIEVISPTGKTLARTTGDFGHFSSVFQEFAPMYEDEDGDIYQSSMFLANGYPSCLCFRRRDDLIVDDDAEFVTHVLFE